MNLNIGNRIALFRKQSDLTQEDLAKWLGVTNQSVSKWESGKCYPDVELLPQMAQLFGCSLETLFGMESAQPRQGQFFDFPMDNVIRVVQVQNNRILQVDDSKNSIEIAFPRNCNQQTQYFKVEVLGHLCADGSINGDVVSYGYIECHDINGDVKQCDGYIECSDINGNVNAGQYVECGDINGGVSCGQYLECGDIAGAVVAGQFIECGDISGDTTAGQFIDCGDITCQGNVTAGEITASGNITCNQIENKNIK